MTTMTMTMTTVTGEISDIVLDVLLHWISLSTWDLGQEEIRATEDIGYYDYLGTRLKNSHRPIIVTGRYGRLR